MNDRVRKDGEGAAAPTGPTMESAHVPGPLAMTRRASLVHAAPGKRQLKAGGRKRRAGVLGRTALYAKAGPSNEARDDHGRWSGGGSGIGASVARHYQRNKQAYINAAFRVAMAAVLGGVSYHYFRQAAKMADGAKRAYHYRPPPGSGGSYRGSSGGQRAARSSSGMSLAEAHKALGVKPGASAEEIKRAYRSAMQTAHPDKGGSVAAAQRLNAANDALRVRKADIAKFNADEPRDEHGRWTATGISVGGRVGATLGAIAGATAGYHTPANVRQAAGRVVGGVRGAATGALLGATLRGRPLAGASLGGRYGSRFGSSLASSRVAFAIAGAGIGGRAGRSIGERAGARLGRRIATLRKFSGDEPRDERGRWTSEGGSSSAAAPHERVFKPDAVAQHVGTLTAAIGSVAGGTAGGLIGGPFGLLAGFGGNYFGDRIGRYLGERLTSAARARSGGQLKSAILGVRSTPDDDQEGRLQRAAAGALGGEFGRQVFAAASTHGAKLGAGYFGSKLSALGGAKAKFIGEVLGTAGGEYGAKLVRHLFGKSFDFTPTAIRKRSAAWKVGCKIVKSNPKGLVYGWASVIEKNGNVITDHQGDRIHSDELVKAAHDYVTSSRAGKLMHKGKDVGHIVESVVFTHELQKALGVDLGKVGWLIGYQITDPAAKAEFQKGKFRAFSIGGSGIREDV